jgi:hypothetical protein
VEGIVYNVFEAVDVITLIKGGVYDDLNLSVGDALKKRSPVSDAPTISAHLVANLFIYRRISQVFTLVPSTTALIPSSTPSVDRVFIALSL